jgi:hypothetical protein
MAPSATTSNGTGSSALAKSGSKPGQRNLEGISNYTKFWQKDAKDDSSTDMDNRLDQYTSVVNGACGCAARGCGTAAAARAWPGSDQAGSAARRSEQACWQQWRTAGRCALWPGQCAAGPVRTLRRGRQRSALRSAVLYALLCAYSCAYSCSMVTGTAAWLVDDFAGLRARMR